MLGSGDDVPSAFPCMSTRMRLSIVLLFSLVSLHSALAQFGCANWVSQGPFAVQDSDSCDNLSNGVDSGYAGASTLPFWLPALHF